MDTTTDWKVVDDVRVAMIREWLENRGYSHVLDCTPAARSDKVMFAKSGQSFSITRRSNYGRPVFKVNKGFKSAGGEWVWAEVTGIDEECLREHLPEIERRIDAMLRAAG